MAGVPEIVITFPGGKRVDAELAGQLIRTDQSRYAGGEGSAPEPFSLFLASIGTCAGIYVLSFLQSRSLPTEGVRLTQRLHFDRETRRLARVDLSIELPDAIPAKYHDAIIRAADQCAVKKALQSPPDFRIEVTPPSPSAAESIAAN